MTALTMSGGVTAPCGPVCRRSRKARIIAGQLGPSSQHRPPNLTTTAADSTSLERMNLSTKPQADDVLDVADVPYKRGSRR